jgi:uncharacterized membrane protein
MSTDIIQRIWKTMWFVMRSLFFIVMLALAISSIIEIYTVVIETLLTSKDMDEIVLGVVLISALIPFGYMSAYSSILFIMCWRHLQKLRHRKIR